MRKVCTLAVVAFFALSSSAFAASRVVRVIEGDNLGRHTVPAGEHHIFTGDNFGTILGERGSVVELKENNMGHVAADEVIVHGDNTLGELVARSGTLHGDNEGQVHGAIAIKGDDLPFTSPAKTLLPWAYQAISTKRPRAEIRADRVAFEARKKEILGSGGQAEAIPKAQAK